MGSEMCIRDRWYTGNLDLSKLNIAAEIVVGEHDFLSFSKKNLDIDNTNCTIFQSQWQESSKIVNYYVSANRFLHHMVRYLVGTMVAISRGNYTIGEFKECSLPTSLLFIETTSSFFTFSLFDISSTCSVFRSLVLFIAVSYTHLTLPTKA